MKYSEARKVPAGSTLYGVTGEGRVVPFTFSGLNGHDGAEVAPSSYWDDFTDVHFKCRQGDWPSFYVLDAFAAEADAIVFARKILDEAMADAKAKVDLLDERMKALTSGA